jgi:hypothetical protein
MQESFVIKYSYKSDEGFDLTSVGESFMGFDAVLKDILETAHLGESIEVKTTRVKQGSIEVYNALVSLNHLPFDSVPAFLEFLKIAAPELINEANTFFSSMHGVHRTVNDYFARNPVDLNLLMLVAGYIVGSMDLAGKLKGNKGVPKDTQASPRQINRLRRMVEGGRYRRALTPITHGSVASISLATVSKQAKSLSITESNVGNYLPDDGKILPEFANGDVVTLTGKLLSLQSTRGDMIKIDIDGIDPQNSLLSGVPVDGTNIEDYKEFFKQLVLVEAEINRKSLYKRPELVIRTMSLAQSELEI